MSPYEIQSLLYDTLHDEDPHITDETIDEGYDTAMDTDEINILQMSYDPISIALQPSSKDWHQTERTIHEVRQQSSTLGHMDGGSMATTTDQKELLFDLVPLTTAPKLRVADSRAHIPTHTGKMYLQTTSARPVIVQCFYTPSLPATILSPTSIAKRERGTGYSATANLSGKDCTVTIHKQHEREDIRVPCWLKQGLLFADIIKPIDIQQTLKDDSVTQITSIPSYPLQCQEVSTNEPSQPHDDSGTDEDSDARARLRHLWHQRLNHINFRLLGEMHKYVKGVPKLGKPHPLDKCATCMQEKLRKSNSSKRSSRRSTIPNQGISIDFGFIVQASKTDSTRVSRLQGLHGETCYCLIADHFTGALYGECFATKAPPIRFINNWLMKHAPRSDVRDKYVCMDLGGELGRSSEVVSIFEQAGYSIEFTSPNHSHQNGPVERPHQSIATALRTMLHGANLEPKYWPYAFHHYLRTYNCTPHGEL